jgi:nucleotide-binding universal stress UspA family protein
MLDPGVTLALAVPSPPAPVNDGQDIVHLAQERSRQVGRDVVMLPVIGELGAEVVRLAKEGAYDLIVLAPSGDAPDGPLSLVPWIQYVLRNAHCRVFVASSVVVPQVVAE